MRRDIKKILVLCTGNSCRSIMAEALINHLAPEKYRALSAGSKPTGYVHPKSLQVLKDHGISTDGLQSQSWDEFKDQSFDLIITVCDSAHAETCPVFLGECKKIHWSTPDPASEKKIDFAFNDTFNKLRKKIEKELL